VLEEEVEEEVEEEDDNDEGTAFLQPLPIQCRIITVNLNMAVNTIVQKLLNVISQIPAIHNTHTS
jgi:hypothetical protein